jgi:PTS system nitrogen regulatory IIA component
MEINLKTAAFMLGASEEMLLRWVKQGVIQPAASDGEVLFDEKVLNEWAAKRRMPVRRVQAGERVVEELTGGDKSSLTAVMSAGGVYFNVPGTDAKSALHGALESIRLPLPVDREELTARLLAREALASTGIGGGIAIPHPRKPLDGLPDTGLIATCFLRAPVDFNAVDGLPVFVMFLLFSPTTKRHLGLLSKLSFCLSNPSVAGLLPNVKDQKTLLQAISEVEKSIQSTGA